MTALDYFVLIATILGIAAYGMWKTRGRKNLEDYLKGKKSTGWGTIGLSVMATQASAVTFLSMPGQAYESGIGFIQNYFGMPIALVIVAAVFVPIYRRLKVYTAYEYLGRRFDTKTRLLGAVLFLLQRGLAAGITIYAPAIILSTVLGWPLDATIVGSGTIVILYTVFGGTEAVNLTQKHQMAVILIGMIAAFGILLYRLPAGVGISDMFHVAGSMGKLEAVDFSLDTQKRYTIWTGILGGVFLSLSYFGTDQSQVQRYLSGGSVRESRLGLMFNALLKVPMQFAILMLGAAVFVFYQFEPAPVYFNQTAWKAEAALDGQHGEKLRVLETEFNAAHTAKEGAIRAWLEARRSGDAASEASARAAMLAVKERSDALQQEARTTLRESNPQLKSSDADYVFITFVLNYLPHGIIGLLVAVIFSAGFSSTASELNALGSTTAVDFYRHVFRRDASDAHFVAASKLFTALWGVIAVSAAVFANLVENLIQAVNIVGSIFYGVVLGIFLVAFFFKRIGGTAVFWSAVIVQSAILAIYYLKEHFEALAFSYLWYNLIGCVGCVMLSVLFQALAGTPKREVA